MPRWPKAWAVLMTVLLWAGTAWAQGGVYTPERYYVGESGRFFIEPSVGYAIFGDLAHIEAVLGGEPEDVREGIVYDLDDGPNVGIRIGWNFSNSFSLQAGATYSPTTLQYLYGGEELSSIDLIALGGNLTPTSTGLASIDIYRAYGGITFNWTFPDVSRIVPMLGAGVTAVQYQVVESPQTVDPASNELGDYVDEFRPPTHIVNETETDDISQALESTDFGWYFMIGVQVGVSNRFALGLELQNFQTRYQLKDNNVIQGVDAIVNNQTVISFSLMLQL